MKQNCTPGSSHNLFIADSKPEENGSVSACLAVTPNRSMASSWREGGTEEERKEGEGRGRNEERERESVCERESE